MPAISIRGPGADLAPTFPGNPFQAACNVENNSLVFKSNFHENIPSLPDTASTPSAIVVSGYHDAVKITGNFIKGTRFLAVDARVSTTPAISATYTNLSGTAYPQTTNITGNVICNWIGKGIYAVSDGVKTSTGLNISSNSISGVTSNAINVVGCSGSAITANTISSVINEAILVQRAGATNNQKIIIASNIIDGRPDGGVSGCTYGISMDFAVNCEVISNTIANAATAPYLFASIAGAVVIKDSQNFPRSGAGGPAGVLVPYFIGEEYFDTTASKWWKSHGLAAANWTQLTN